MPESKITKPAVTSIPISEVIANRWSPRVFDESFELSDQESLALLEAARWAPSSNNSQPWRFVFSRRGDQNFETVSKGLLGFNQSWAPHASALVVVLINRFMPDGSEAPLPISYYNAGLASSQLVFEAEALGLKAHYMSGIDFPGLEEALAMPELKIVACIAVGKQGELSKASPDIAAREVLARERKDLAEIVVRGLPAQH